MFIVHCEGRPNMEFSVMISGLHVHVPGNKGLAFINTVKDNMEGFTKWEVKGAQLACCLYALLAYPSMSAFRWAVMTSQIANCPVTVANIEVAQQIWGKDVAALKGKTTHKRPNAVADDALKIPRAFVGMRKNVLLLVDIFYVNKITFLLTYSRRIAFTAVSHITLHKLDVVLAGFQSIFNFYQQCGFPIVLVHADSEFAPLRNAVNTTGKGPFFNLASKSEHVPEIERCIKVVKEQFRSI